MQQGEVAPVAQEQLQVAAGERARLAGLPRGEAVAGDGACARRSSAGRPGASVALLLEELAPLRRRAPLERLIDAVVVVDAEELEAPRRGRRRR